MVKDPVSRSHRVGTKALLPFAEGSDGQIVHVSSVANGKKCGCICPECRGRLIAYHPRGKKIAYFGHESVANCDPPRALETALHKLAKQLIDSRKEILLPPVFAKIDNKEILISNGGIFRPHSVALEEQALGMRPDIIARREQRILFIEIAVRHKVGADKLKRIRDLQQPTVEIDLSKWRHEHDEEKLSRAILHDAPRMWLFNSAAAEKEAEEASKKEAYARKQHDRMVKHADFIIQEYNRILPSQKSNKIQSGKFLDAAQQAGMDSEIGIDIAGSIVFGVSHRVWQSTILTLLLRRGNISIATILRESPGAALLSGATTLALRDHAVDWKVIEHVSGGRVREPRTVLCTYLDSLCARGVAIRYGKDHYGATWDAKQRAEAAWEEANARGVRLAQLRKTFDQIVEVIGDPGMTFNAWSEVRHHGLDAPPSELVHRGGQGWLTLHQRMKGIKRLVEANAAVVEGGLLGFPADHHLAARVRDAERRRLELEERKAARIAAENVRKAQEAMGRLADMRSAASEAGPAGVALLRQPLDALKGQSIEDSKGVMSLAEAEAVWDIIRCRQSIEYRKRAEEDAARQETAKLREKLIQYATATLGHNRAVKALNTPNPRTSNLSPIEYCRDRITYEVSVMSINAIKRML